MKKSINYKAGAAIALSLATFPAASSGASYEKTMQPMEEKLYSKMKGDRIISSLGIQSDIKNGKAILGGEVPNLLTKERAQRIAENMRGIREVENNIKVKPPRQISKGEIASNVKRAMLVNPATEAYEVDVEVDDEGSVILRGLVESWRERSLSEKITKSINGVTDVMNLISVNEDAGRSDAEIQADINQTLKWDALVDHSEIQATVEDGAVTMSGKISNLSELNRIHTNAWVNGVNEVDVRRVRIDEDFERNFAKTANFKPTDNEVASAVRRMLENDLHYDLSQISIDSEDGVVTIRGETKTLSAKKHAATLARMVYGVNEVKSRLSVSRGNSTSVEIEENIREALKRDSFLGDETLAVEVIGNAAYIDGSVSSHFEKAQAERVASEIPGVESIYNNVVVDGVQFPYVYNPYLDDWDWSAYSINYSFPSNAIPTAEDQEIAEEIREEFFWSPFVDSDDVRVTVSNGIAKLEGEVDHWAEYNSAIENAYEGGAFWVDGRDLKVNASDS